MNRTLLVLDSSGTITDALPERFLVAHNAYVQFDPTTNLFAPVPILATDFLEPKKELRERYEEFSRLNVYVQSGSDTYVIFRIMEDGLHVVCEEEFLRVKTSLSQDVLQNYFSQFKRIRGIVLTKIL